MIRLPWALVAALALLPGCRKAEPPPVEAEPFVEFRRELADPDRHPIRKGRHIDLEGLRAPLTRYMDEHAADVDRAIRESARALGRSPVPKEPSYVRACGAAEEVLEGFAEVARGFILRRPDAGVLARGLLGASLPLCMTQDLGMTSGDVGAWMTFFSLAEPDVRLCEDVNDVIGVCLWYGEPDVLVARLMHGTDGAWTPIALEWWQQAP